jgi:hypothetical protein
LNSELDAAVGVKPIKSLGSPDTPPNRVESFCACDCRSCAIGVLVSPANDCALPTAEMSITESVGPPGPST